MSGCLYFGMLEAYKSTAKVLLGAQNNFWIYVIINLELSWIYREDIIELIEFDLWTNSSKFFFSIIDIYFRFQRYSILISVPFSKPFSEVA